MNVFDQDSIKLHPEAAMEAAAVLEQMIAEVPDFANADVDRILRVVPEKRAVFAGSIAGKNAVFRLAIDKAEKNLLHAGWDELSRVSVYMDTGKFRVNLPIAYDQKYSVSAVEFAEGQPFIQHLWALPPSERLEQIAQAGAWLRHYTRPTEEVRNVNCGPWRKWAGNACLRQPHKRLQKIEARVLQKMRKLSHRLSGLDWRAAISHGDFHAGNLISAPDYLTGIDTSASNKAPIYKDIARFLTHLARRGMLPSGERIYGVDRGAFDALTGNFEMTELERHSFMPFFIAFETLIKVEHKNLTATRVRLGIELAESLFEDLRVVANNEA